MSEMGQFADVFPYIKNSCTSDPRIFQTPWQKIAGDKKKKTYFACLVGGSCYGVDVIKDWDAEKRGVERQCAAAYAMVKQAVYTFEDTGEWPKPLAKE